MRLLSLAFLLSIGCAEDTKIETTDSGPIGNDSGGGDTDTDTDADSDTDTDADSDTDTDSDTDADTDTDTDVDTGDDVTEDLTGRTYVVSLADATITEPSGIGSFLSGYLTQEILLGVVSVSDTEIEMIGTIAVEGSSPAEQDYCLATIDFPTADFTGNPDFQIGPSDLSLDVGGVTIALTELLVTGTFEDDGSAFEDGVLSGTIDTRPLDAMVGDGSEGIVCEYAAFVGATCEACPSDGGEFCLSLVAEDITGIELEGVAVAFVPGNNCEACESGPPAEDAVCDG
ncbi:MAG: hypothetical protein V4850_11315 [Myxococcota bacterium]